MMCIFLMTSYYAGLVMYWHCIAIRCAAIACTNVIVKLIDGPFC